MAPTQTVAEGEPIRLRPFLGALLDDFAVSARARHVTLDAFVFLEEIDGDASLIRRLLARLVGEALRRAPAGTNVSVVVSPREGQAEFRIADEGAGIPVEARDQILEADATQGKQLSVTETNYGTVVCLAFPYEVEGTGVAQLAVNENATLGAAEAKPASVRRGSGIYARAGELASTLAGGEASRPAQESGKKT